MEPAHASPAIQDSRVPGRSRRRDLVEIAIAYGLILSVIWTPRPLQHLLWWAAAAVIALLVATSFEGCSAAGLGGRNFLRSLWVVAAALAVSAVAVAISSHLRTLHAPGSAWHFVTSYWAYALWSGVQQFLLQCFFLSRLLRLLPRPWQAALAAAGLFALAHLPNPFLVVLTILWGPLACLLFLRYRNLYPLAIAHAILGITIAIAVPGYVDHNMRVGLGYLKYHRGQRRAPQVQRSHSDHRASTVAWVTAAAPTLRSRIQARP